jgi:predicted amidohydrolase
VTRSSSLRVALVVPDYRFPWNDDRQFQIESLRAQCRGGEIELAVFPEGYAEGGSADDVESLAEDLGVAVLVGLTHKDGFQLAAYRNPRAAPGETVTHLYVKHSTAERLAYDWPGYAGPSDPMFDPVVLHGQRIGVLICHDMFFGLPAQLERARGATMFVDISGGDVNEAKWTNVVRGRSVELGVPFLCTMARRGDAGKALALAYKGLHRYIPHHDSTGVASRGGFAVIAIGAGTLAPAEVDQQAYTDKVYADITIALATDADADVSIALSNGTIGVVSNRLPCRRRNGWTEVTSRAGRIGVLPVAIAQIDDGTLLHRRDLGADAFDHQIIVYAGERSKRSALELLALAKLRAIEHRVAVVLLTDAIREVIKTNRYKNIQRFVEHGGVFGLNAEFLGGLWSTASAKPTMGVPRDQFAKYRALLLAPESRPRA